MNTGIIYYSHGRVPPLVGEAVRRTIARSGLPVVSVTLSPLDFGENYVLSAQPSILTLWRQIALALEMSESPAVFFCEHDVLYHPDHFGFRPSRLDTFYYNLECWRWDYPGERLIRYDKMCSLSGLCVGREAALDHFRLRISTAERLGLPDGREPDWARKWAYEPGRPKRRGGIRDEPMEFWWSVYPNVDVRHGQTMTPRKVTLAEFKHPPESLRETTLAELPGWDAEELRKLCGH